VFLLPSGTSFSRTDVCVYSFIPSGKWAAAPSAKAQSSPFLSVFFPHDMASFHCAPTMILLTPTPTATAAATAAAITAATKVPPLTTWRLILIREDRSTKHNDYQLACVRAVEVSVKIQRC